MRPAVFWFAFNRLVTYCFESLDEDDNQGSSSCGMISLCSGSEEM